jgi:hypothetical protein
MNRILNFGIVALILMVCASVPVLAQSTFTIGDSTGEPLEPLDQIQILSSITYPSNYIYSDAYVYLYYLGSIIEGPIHLPFEKQHFYIDTDYTLKGYADMHYGPYTWADELWLEIKFARAGFPGQLSHMSINSLEVLPLTPQTPSIGLWGIVALLLLIPALIIFKR